LCSPQELVNTLRGVKKSSVYREEIEVLLR